jgi:transcriptional regulator with XRE-family HTH domain
MREGKAMTFAQKLRELRDQAGLSEMALARKSGVAFGALHYYVLGRRKPSFAAVVKLAAALGVTCEAFADCDDVRGEDAREQESVTPAPKRGRPPKPKGVSATDATTQPGSGPASGAGKPTQRRKKKTGSGGPQEGGG